MQRRYNLAHFILASVIVLVLTPLMVDVEAQAQIIFVSHRDGNMEIYVMDAGGGNQRRLTENRGDDWSPSWSPDGKRIIFVSDRDGHPDVIPGWFTSEIYVMDADGGNPQNLTNTPLLDDKSPSWSPNGKRIAFMSRRKGNFTFGIYVMDADGGNQLILTNNPLDDRNPSWSPNGKQIVFASSRDGHFRGASGITSEIYVMDADGQNVQKLTNNRGYDSSPSWSPDGKKILFHSERDGKWDIYVMDADGDNLENLTNNRHSDVSPAWYNPPFSISPTGKKFTMWGWLKQIDR